jgi:hypothetical protein
MASVKANYAEYLACIDHLANCVRAHYQCVKKASIKKAGWFNKKVY